MRRDPILKRQRRNDHFLMQIAIDGRFNLTLIQQCRLFLQVNTVADISTAMGTQLETWSRHSKGRPSKLEWPNQGRPSRKVWEEWNRFLDSLLISVGELASRTLKPTYKLGDGSLLNKSGHSLAQKNMQSDTPGNSTGSMATHSNR